METHNGTTATTERDAQEQPKRVGRRGLIAGAAALTVGMAAATVAERAEAANGDPVLLGTTNAATGTTSIYNSTPALSPTLFRVANYGSNSPAPPSNTRVGIYGLTDNTSTSGAGDTGATAVGVLGTGNNATTAGNAIGVYGISTGYGVVGVTNGTAYGLYGIATVNGSAAFAGGTSNPNAYACVLGGRVQINGSLVVTGAKSAAVPHPDGSHRLVYCVEAPESWLEDFGTGKIVSGRAEVRFDPDFAAVIDAKDVHVFVTEHDGNNDVHVPTRTAQGFTVQADTSKVAARGKRMTDVNGTFSYRVVARRKDIPANRLAKVEIRKVPIENPIGPFTEGKGDKK